MNDFSYIKRNYEKIRESIAKCAQRSGVSEPVLVAVTKSAELCEIDALLSLGIDRIAENRVQMLTARYEHILSTGAPMPEMHLIGQLQSNKVKYIADKAALIHSLDKLSLAKEINRQGEKIGRKIPCLIEINSGREQAKGGVMPEDADELAESVKDMPFITLSGVMTMAPICERQSDYSKYFSLTRDIFERLMPLYGTDKPVLSMGMSNSYEAAIAEGATLLRVGRAFFEK